MQCIKLEKKKNMKVQKKKKEEAAGHIQPSYEFSKMTPMTLGNPPLTIESSPGHELDGNEVEALLYVTACRLNFARTDSGLSLTRLARSRPCIPSILRSRTC